MFSVLLRFVDSDCLFRIFKHFLCGLVYVREPKWRLHIRICGHRSVIKNNLFPRVYHYCRQPDQSNLSMKDGILEKINRPCNNPILSTPVRRQKEEHWIRKVGTAMPYGCNDKIDSVGNLCRPGCSNVNMMNIVDVDKTPRRKRNHGHRQYTSHKLHDVSINDLIPYSHKPLGMHHIRTKLYSLPLSQLHSLYTTGLKTSTTDLYSTLCKHIDIILDIGQHRHFKSVTILGNKKENMPFLQLFSANKGLDIMNLGNILAP